jgi:hypothetical protein
MSVDVREIMGIRDYWQTKVVEQQANIKARLINLYLGDNVVPPLLLPSGKASLTTW